MKLPKKYMLDIILSHKLKQMPRYKHYVRSDLECDFLPMGLSNLQYKMVMRRRPTRIKMADFFFFSNKNDMVGASSFQNRR